MVRYTVVVEHPIRRIMLIYKAINCRPTQLAVPCRSKGVVVIVV